MVMHRVWHSGFFVGMLMMALAGFAGMAHAAKPELKGNFQVLSE